MSKLMKRVKMYKVEAIHNYDSLKCKVKKLLSNNKGFGLIETIIVMAIIILGILAIRPAIVALFTDTVTAFATWIAQKRGELFN